MATSFKRSPIFVYNELEPDVFFAPDIGEKVGPLVFFSSSKYKRFSVLKMITSK